MRRSMRVLGISILVLTSLTACIWSAAFAADHRGVLAVSFLNVGQGNAVFIQAPSGRQVLIDGGPDTSVLRALSSVMPWWDHSLDVVISTSPAKNDSTGLVDVLERFSAARIIRSGVQTTDTFSRALDDAFAKAKESGAVITTAKRGQAIDLGRGAYIEILSPDRNVQGVDAASGCTVVRVIYGTTSFLLPCDAPQALENYLVYLDGISLHSDVLLVGAHGAKTSSSPVFIGYVSPTYAVDSHDCKNVPTEEVSATLARFNVQIFDTCTDGTVMFVSDGETVRKD